MGPRLPDLVSDSGSDSQAELEEAQSKHRVGAEVSQDSSEVRDESSQELIELVAQIQGGLVIRGRENGQVKVLELLEQRFSTCGSPDVVELQLPTSSASIAIGQECWEL